MDESGHSGDTGPAEGGRAAEPRDRSPLNGWATPDNPWSNAGSALDPEEDVPAWRRPSQEIRPFARQTLPPEGEVRSFPDENRPFQDQNQSSEVRPFGSPPNPFSASAPITYGAAPTSTFGEGGRPSDVRFGDLNRSGEVRPDESPSGEVRRFGSADVRPFVDESPSGDVRAFGDERPSGEVRAYGDERPSGEVRAYGDEWPSGEVRAFGDGGARGFGEGEARRFGDDIPSGEVRRFGDASRSGDILPPAPRPEPQPENPPPRWSDSRTRYSDLLNHFVPKGGQPTAVPPPAPPRFQPLVRPDSLEDDDRRLGRLDAPPPDSAPPYPYEGDLDDARRQTPPAATQQRAAVPVDRPRATFPAVRPATPGGRRVDWLTTAERARHSLDPPSSENAPGDDQNESSAEPAPSEGSGAGISTAPLRSSYDPTSFPRRLPYETASPPGSAPPATGYASPTAYSGRSAGDPGATPIGEQVSRALPQRVPAEPDVPTIPEPPSVEPTAETPALARIATHLRRGDVLSSEERQDGFDVKAILEAVREVEGVRDASLRSTPQGAHSLRLDLAEGADPAEVSRQVARLLQDRMGLDAAMQGGSETADRPAAGSPARPTSPPPPTAFVPSQAGPTGRASVPGATIGEDVRRSMIARSAEPVTEEDVRRGPVTEEDVRRGPVTEEDVRRGPVTGQDVRRGPIARPAEPITGEELRWAPTARAVEPTTGEDLRRLPTAPQPARVPEATAAPVVATAAAPTSAEPADVAGTVETVPSGVECGPPRPLEVNEQPGPRVLIENVQVNTFGTEATVEVRLAVAERTAAGIATGPAVDGYLLRLCAMATAQAIDELLAASQHADGPARCFVEHAAAVPFGPMQVAVVVMLLSCGGWVEQLAGSAVVAGDDRHAMVRATLAAVNRRLEALLS